MTKKYKQFRFEKYHFDYETYELSLHYSYDGERSYKERVSFSPPTGETEEVNRKMIDALAFYTFIVAGTSYYKSFVAAEMVVVDRVIDYWQADFFNMIYRGGLGQFLYENELKPDAVAQFSGTVEHTDHPEDYEGAGVLLMQSGGKDSLLSAELMRQAGNEFTSWHMSSTGKYPPVLDELGADVLVGKRRLDLEAIHRDWDDGAYNGHIPFSALYAGFAMIQAVLHGKNLVIASNERSADQANVMVDGFEVNHQFSKTYQVEQAIERYLHRYVSSDLHYGSILRPLNDVQVAALFARLAWPKYRQKYSSCNLANYKQGSDDGRLSWDGTCAKCANTFLILAPFVPKLELLELFGGKNLLRDGELTETFRQLLGMSDIKPFECVGTFEELQWAYAQACRRDSDFCNPDIRPTNASLDVDSLGQYQAFFDEFLNYKKILRPLKLSD